MAKPHLFALLIVLFLFSPLHAQFTSGRFAYNSRVDEGVIHIEKIDGSNHYHVDAERTLNCPGAVSASLEEADIKGLLFVYCQFPNSSGTLVVDRAIVRATDFALVQDFKNVPVKSLKSNVLGSVHTGLGKDFLFTKTTPSSYAFHSVNANTGDPIAPSFPVFPAITDTLPGIAGVSHDGLMGFETTFQGNNFGLIIKAFNSTEHGGLVVPYSLTNQIFS